MSFTWTISHLLSLMPVAQTLSQKPQAGKTTF